MNQSTELKWKLVGVLGKWAVDALCATVRIDYVGLDQVAHILASRRFINAFWHSRILLISYLYQGWDGVIMTSQSDDGEIIARVVSRQGHEPVRGSTTRGGRRALATLIRKLKQRDRPAVIIPDGPQGPRFVVQPGIITLAKKTGYPIVPMTYSARHRKVFRSWDRFIVPYPFTQCRMIYGRPVYVPEDASRARQESLRQELENEMNRITVEADAYFGHVTEIDI